jgi:hypothetical protein
MHSDHNYNRLAIHHTAVSSAVLSAQRIISLEGEQTVPCHVIALRVEEEIAVIPLAAMSTELMLVS